MKLNGYIHFSLFVLILLCACVCVCVCVLSVILIELIDCECVCERVSERVSRLICPGVHAPIVNESRTRQVFCVFSFF